MMFLLPVNMWAILVSTLVSMLLGFLWYSPILFGKPWMKLSKIDPKKMKSNMIESYLTSFLATIIMTYILSQLVSLTLTASIVDGATLGAMVWLGFVATTLVNSVLFESKPWKLFFINSGYQLVCLILSGIILAVWV